MLCTSTRRGTATTIALVFLLILTALAAAFGAIVSSSTSLSRNEQNAARAQSAAESGMELLKNYLSQVIVPPNVPDSSFVATIATSLDSLAFDSASQRQFYVAMSGQNILFPAPQTAGAAQPWLSLFPSRPERFRAILQPDALPITTSNNKPWYLTATIEGWDGSSVDSSGQPLIKRKVYVSFRVRDNGGPFSVGVYTAGTISLKGNSSILGDLGSVRSIYYPGTALSMGGSSYISGSVTTHDGISQVSGKIGSIAQGVKVNTETYSPPEFNPARIVDYLSRDPNTGQIRTYTGAYTNATYTNVMIPANSTINMDGGCTFNGVLYVGKGSTVVVKNATLNCVVVIERDYAVGSTLPSGAKRGSFDVTANGHLNPIPSTLPELGELKNMLSGYSILGPTANVTVGANGTVQGSIIAWTADLGGGGEITILNGTVIVNSPSTNSLSLGSNGNGTITFNRDANYVPPTWGITSPTGKRYLVLELSTYADRPQ